MPALFRSITNPKAFRHTITSLKKDLQKGKGAVSTVSEVVEIRGDLVEVSANTVPWGSLVIKKPLTRLEALVWWHSDIEDIDE